MVFNVPSSPVSTDPGTESGGKIGFLRFFPRRVFARSSSPASTDSDTKRGGKKLLLELKLKVQSRPYDKITRKAMRVLSLSHLGIDTACFDGREETLTLVGYINPVEVVFELRKICVIDIVSAAILTARNGTAVPTTERITELILMEDTDLETKRSSGIRICEEQQEQSEKQQEDRPPPGQADSRISQEQGSPLSRRPPPLSLPLASEVRPSSLAASHPSQGTSNQTQAAADQAPELSFPFAPSSLRTFRTESLADMPAQSSIFGGACLPKDRKLMEEEGLGGHDQLYDSAVHHLLSGINGIGELKRRYELRAGEQASRLKEVEDTAVMLRKQVEELEAKVLMADMSERRLVDMLCISEGRHERTKRELALMQEKMDEADRRIEHLEAAVSRYQNRIVEAEAEKEKAEERACSQCRASVEGGTMSRTRPSPADPRGTSLSFVPSPSPRLPDLEGCKESALFPELTDLLSGQILNNKRLRDSFVKDSSLRFGVLH